MSFAELCDDRHSQLTSTMSWGDEFSPLCMGYVVLLWTESWINIVNRMLTYHNACEQQFFSDVSLFAKKVLASSTCKFGLPVALLSGI